MDNQEANYNETLVSVQDKLSPASRVFSKVIHNPVVEKTSEVMEQTIMRPAVVMSATWTAFLAGLIFYLTARFYGFTLAGSEMLLALVGGGVLGLTLEMIWNATRRRLNK